MAEPPQIRAAKARVEILGTASNACELSAFMSAPFDIALRARFAQDKIASFLGAKSNLSYRTVQTDPRGVVSGIREFSHPASESMREFSS
jgi:hypothetical protein